MLQDILKREEAISNVKEFFSKELIKNLNLVRVSSPLIVLDGTGINDDLNGVERPVKFPVKCLNEKYAVVVHSLAKWKRLRLKELDVEEGRGILTDMRALRPDEDYSPLHSIYVDQWDWEKHILPQQRTLGFLKETVKKIYEAFKSTEKMIQLQYPHIAPTLPQHITFIQSEELLKKYPGLNAKQRENEAAKEYGAIFIMGIGGKLSDNNAHDGRAADYDDWSTQNEEGYKGLNGDILFWHPKINCALEVSSMGIRVDEKALQFQLKEKNSEYKSKLPFHSMLLSNQLPASIGGGIGQSRTCMFLLKHTHIGEVQVGVWPESQREEARVKGITLL